MNAGEKILLRLRPAWEPDTFYEEDQVVRVMLHEVSLPRTGPAAISDDAMYEKLTHNVHGPHDEKFYKFLAGLEEEYDTLRRTGYAGEGFFSQGRRLGVGVSHDLPPHLARLKALEAAEKRRKLGNIMSGGGRLGGRAPILGLNPRELAAMVCSDWFGHRFVDLNSSYRLPFGERRMRNRAVPVLLRSEKLPKPHRRASKLM